MTYLDELNAAQDDEAKRRAEIACAASLDPKWLLVTIEEIRVLKGALATSNAEVDRLRADNERLRHRERLDGTAEEQRRPAPNPRRKVMP